MLPRECSDSADFEHAIRGNRIWLTRPRSDGYVAALRAPGRALWPLASSPLRRPTQGLRTHEAHLSTEPDPAPSCPRLPLADEDPRWPPRAQTSPRQGTEAAHSVDSVETRVIPATGPFPREARIRRSSEFKAIATAGGRHSSRSFVMLVGQSPAASGTRLGVTVSRKVGNAVVRNRVKRRIREWFRRDGRALVSGRDVVVIARSSAADLTGAAAFAELSRIARGVR